MSLLLTKINQTEWANTPDFKQTTNDMARAVERKLGIRARFFFPPPPPPLTRLTSPHIHLLSVLISTWKLCGSSGDQTRLWCSETQLHSISDCTRIWDCCAALKDLITLSRLIHHYLKAAGQWFITDCCDCRAVRTLPALFLCSYWWRMEEMRIKLQIKRFFLS